MDVRKSCAAVTGRVIFIGFGIQIILGIFWMCNAFAGLHGFGEGIVCVGQTALLGAGLWFVLRESESRGQTKGEQIKREQKERKQTEGKQTEGKHAGRLLFMVAAVLSFPMVLQSLMKPDLRVLVAFFLLLGAGACRQKKRGSRLIMVCSVVLSVGVVAATNYENNLLTLCSSRFVWTTLYQDYENLPEEEADKIDYTAMVESTYEVSGIETILVPSLRDTLEEGEVHAVLKQLIGAAWRMHKGRIIKEILWDEGGYLFPPLVVPLQLAHRAYDSRTGLNYRQFLQPAPVLGKYVMRYGCFWFAAAFLLRGILWLLEGCPAGDRSVLLYAAVTAAGLSCWYTFSTAGRMDYRNVVYILCVWLLWMTDLRTEKQKEGMQDVGQAKS